MYRAVASELKSRKLSHEISEEAYWQYLSVAIVGHKVRPVGPGFPRYINDLRRLGINVVGLTHARFGKLGWMPSAHQNRIDQLAKIGCADTLQDQFPRVFPSDSQLFVVDRGQ